MFWTWSVFAVTLLALRGSMPASRFALRRLGRLDDAYLGGKSRRPKMPLPRGRQRRPWLTRMYSRSCSW